MQDQDPQGLDTVLPVPTYHAMDIDDKNDELFRLRTERHELLMQLQQAQEMVNATLDAHSVSMADQGQHIPPLPPPTTPPRRSEDVYQVLLPEAVIGDHVHADQVPRIEASPTTRKGLFQKWNVGRGGFRVSISSTSIATISDAHWSFSIQIQRSRQRLRRSTAKYARS